MQDYIDNTAEDLEFIEEVLEELRSAYGPYAPAEREVCYSEFSLFKGYTKVKELEQVSFSKRIGQLYLCFVQVAYAVNPGRNGPGQDEQLQSYVMVSLPQDYGSLFIKKEGFVEKLSELLQPVELDFTEDPLFSRQYYVLAKDKEKALLFLNQSMRDVLVKQEYRDFIIEIQGNTLLIGDKKGPAEPSMVNLLRLGEAIIDLVYRS